VGLVDFGLSEFVIEFLFFDVGFVCGLEDEMATVVLDNDDFEAAARVGRRNEPFGRGNRPVRLANVLKKVARSVGEALLDFGAVDSVLVHQLLANVWVNDEIHIPPSKQHPYY
jgi:hypothetical protein